MKTIVREAKKTGKLGYFLEALKFAGLIDTFSGPGPYTFFAPSDKAFFRLPKKVLHSCFKNEMKLKELLLAHVMADRVLAEDVQEMGVAKMVDGKIRPIVVKDEAMMLDGAKIIKSDIICSNGVIHVIDSVILD